MRRLSRLIWIFTICKDVEQITDEQNSFHGTDMTQTNNDGNNRECGAALKNNENPIDFEPGEEYTYNVTRVTKADLEKLRNYGSDEDNPKSPIPKTLEETASFIQTFIDRKNKKKTLSRGRKRKHNEQRGVQCSEVQTESEIILERLELKPEIEAAFFNTCSEDFKLLIFHSKSTSLCQGQRFTKSLVTDKAGENIVTEKTSSSLIYFFYRFLEANKRPEIFIVTFGHTWHIAKMVALDDFSSSIKVRELENKVVHLKELHADGGDVLTTERHARGGRSLHPEQLATINRIEQKSTRFPKDESILSGHTAVKSGSRIYVSDLALSFHLNLSIKLIHDFVKVLSECSQKGSKNNYSLQKLKDKQLITILDNQLLERLMDKHCYTCTYLQNEKTNKWNKVKELKIHIPEKNIPVHLNRTVSFKDVATKLIEHKIPEKDWLENVIVEWNKNTEPLKHFLEDYIIRDGVLYRYLFGEWYVGTLENIFATDRKFRQLLTTSFLKASRDFPILPWIHSSEKENQEEDSQPESTKTQKGKKTRTKTKGDSAKGISQSPEKNTYRANNTRDSAIGISQSPGETPNKTNNADDSAICITQSPSDKQTSSLSYNQSDAPSPPASPAVSTEIPKLKETPDKANYTLDSAMHNILSPTQQQTLSPSQTVLPSVSTNHASSDCIVYDIGKERSDLCDENQKLITEEFKIKKDKKIIHHPVEVDFDRMLKPKRIEDGRKVKIKYIAQALKKVSSSNYFVPEENKSTVDELENLLFLRLCTKMKEGEYNDCHMLLARLLKCYGEDRFIIIPGDELFVSRKNTELYDILISDEEKKITYIIHVKAGFGNNTRDACSQLRLSAQKIEESISCKSSRSALEQYWKNNKIAPGVLKRTYRTDVGKLFWEMGKEKFFKLFTDENRRLVFVFACRDSRKVGLQQEAERAVRADTDVSAETAVRKELLEKCSISETKITEIIDKLKQKKILDSFGEVTNEYMYLNGDEKKELFTEIGKIVQHGSQEQARKVVKETLKSMVSVSDSDIAKCEWINLEKQFQECRVGKKKFELKICQIPVEFYLQQSNDDVTDKNMSMEVEDTDD